jgi:hypothetical protein
VSCHHGALATHRAHHWFACQHCRLQLSRSWRVITPHTGYHGYSDLIFRVHLGLIVPTDGECALHVAGVTQHWTEGGVLAFDDTSLHEAWNRGSTSRIVLLLDVERKPGALDALDTPLYTDELSSLLSSPSSKRPMHRRLQRLQQMTQVDTQVDTQAGVRTPLTDPFFRLSFRERSRAE